MIILKEIYDMKKTYSLPLLVVGLAIILTQIATFTLQNYFTSSFLTLSYSFDLFILLGISFVLILQFKGFEKLVAITAVVYAALGLIYGISSGNAVSTVVESTNHEVIFVLCVLLAYALLTIASLFALIHVVQTKFPTKFTKGFMTVALSLSLVLLICASLLVTTPQLMPIIRSISAYLAIASYYAALVFVIEEKPVYEEPVRLPESEVAIKELDRLYSRGIITTEEYNARKDKLINK